MLSEGAASVHPAGEGSGQPALAGAGAGTPPPSGEVAGAAPGGAAGEQSGRNCCRVDQGLARKVNSTSRGWVK